MQVVTPIKAIMGQEGKKSLCEVLLFIVCFLSSGFSVIPLRSERRRNWTGEAWAIHYIYILILRWLKNITLS